MIRSPDYENGRNEPVAPILKCIADSSNDAPLQSYRPPKANARREGGGGLSDVSTHWTDRPRFGSFSVSWTDRPRFGSFSVSCAIQSYPSAIVNIRSLIIGSCILSARARHCSASRCQSALPRGAAILHLPLQPARKPERPTVKKKT